MLKNQLTPSENVPINKDGIGSKTNFPKKSSFLKRPMATFGFPFFAAMIAVSFLPAFQTEKFSGIWVLGAGVAICAFIFLGLLLNSKTRNNRQIMTVSFAVVTAFSMYFLKELAFSKPLSELEQDSGVLTIQALDYITYDGDSAFVKAKIIEAESPADEILVGKNATFWFFGNEFSVQPYELISGKFDYRMPSDSEAGEIRGFSRSQGIALNLSSGVYGDGTLSTKAPPAKPVGYYIAVFRNRLTESIMTVPQNAETAGIMAGIAIGNKSEISLKTTRDFRAAGLSHLLAVSGLQVTLISQAVFALFNGLKFKKRFSGLAAIFSILLFMALTGFSGSVVRAGLMSIIYFVGFIIGRESDGLNALGLAVILIGVVNPYAVHDVGLLLSFGATLGLIVLMPICEEKLIERVKNRNDLLCFTAPVAEAFFMTISATLFILPVLILNFGYISTISPIANVIVTFPVFLITVLTLIGAGIRLIPPLDLVGEVILTFAGYLTQFVCGVADFFAGLPYAEINVQNTFVLFLLLAVPPFLFLCYKFFGKKGMKLGTLAMTGIIVVGFTANAITMRNSAEISVLPVGNGTGILIRSGVGKDRKNGLVISGEKKIVPKILRELAKTSVKRLDYIVVDSESKICDNIGLLTEAYPTENLITQAGGKYFESLHGFKITGAIITTEAEQEYFNYRPKFNFIPEKLGEEGILNREKAILIGGIETEIMVFPEGYNAGNMAEGRGDYIGIFTVSPPKGYKALNLSASVLNCDKDKLNYVEKAFLDTAYSVQFTAEGVAGVGGLFQNGIQLKMPIE